MNKDRTWAYLEMAGGWLMLLGALMWISGMTWIPYIFAFGVLLMVIGRLTQSNDSVLEKTAPENRQRVVRLFRQRTIGLLFLVLAAVLMCMPAPMHLYQGIYIMKSSWLMPFLCFSVIEVYTTFRLSRLIK